MYVTCKLRRTTTAGVHVYSDRGAKWILRVKYDDTQTATARRVCVNIRTATGGAQNRVPTTWGWGGGGILVVSVSFKNNNIYVV